MSRLASLSTAMKKAMFSPQTDKVVLPLIKISGTGIATPVRLVRNTENVVSTVEGSSNTYLAANINVALPDDKDDGSVKTVQFVADSVDQSLVTIVRSITSPPDVTLWVVIADSPNTKEIGPLTFTTDSAQYDAQTMTLTLKFEEVLELALTGLTFDPVNFAGCH